MAEPSVVALQLAHEFTRQVEEAIKHLQVLEDGKEQGPNSAQHILLALLNLPHVRITVMHAPLEMRSSPRSLPATGDLMLEKVEEDLMALCGSDSPWDMRKVEIAAAHRSVRWENIEEMRSNTLHLPPSTQSDGAGPAALRPHGKSGDEERLELAVFMICNGRWPSRYACVLERVCPLSQTYSFP